MFNKIFCDKFLINTCLLVKFVRFYKTHYEVLKLPTSCTSKEIKEAYIKLSKQYHPDVNKSKQSHKTFLQINEAYKVLGKSDSRRSYDLGMSGRVHITRNAYNPMKDPHFWEHRDRSKDRFYENRAYYGIDGVDKMPNSAVLVGCIVLILVGVGIQFLLIFKSFTLQREDLIRKSMEASRIHRDAQEKALLHGNEIQIELLKMRLERQSSDLLDVSNDVNKSE